MKPREPWYSAITPAVKKWLLSEKTEASARLIYRINHGKHQFVFSFLRFFFGKFGLATPTDRLYYRIGEVQTTINDIGSALDALMKQAELDELLAEIKNQHDNSSTWNIAHLYQDYAFVYQRQLEIIDFVQNLQKCRSDLGKAISLLNNDENATLHCELSELLNTVEKFLLKSLNKLRVKSDNGGSELTQLESEINSLKDKLTRLRLQLEQFCFSKKGSVIGYLRLLSDRSGIESASIVIAFAAASAAIYYRIYYSKYGINIWDYWVVQDYLDASVQWIFVILLVAFGTSYLLRFLYERELKKILNQKAKRGNAFFLSKILTSHQPERVMIVSLLFFSLLYGVKEYYGIFSKNKFEQQYAITNQGILLDDIHLVGTSARTAFFTTDWQSENSIAVKENQIASNTKHETADVIFFAIDRSQILCHSFGDICKKVLQKNKEKVFLKSDSAPVVPSVNFHNIEVIEHTPKDPNQVTTDNPPEEEPINLDLSTTAFNCKPYGNYPIDSLYFNKNDITTYCDSLLESGQSCKASSSDLVKKALAELTRVDEKINHLLILGHTTDDSPTPYSYKLGNLRAKKIASLFSEQDYPVYAETLVEISDKHGFTEIERIDRARDRQVDIFACL